MRASYFLVCSQHVVKDSGFKNILNVHILQNRLESRPLLLCTPPDLRRRQHEPVIPRIPKLNEICPVSLAHLIRIVNAVPCSHVKRGTARSKDKLRALDLANGLRRAPCQVDVLAQLGNILGAVPAERREEVLAVAVPVDEELDAVRVAKPVDEGVQAGHLGGVAWGLTLVAEVARVSRGAVRVSIPLVGPVAVDVAAPADCRVVRRRLPVFTPKAVVCLRVDESCGCQSRIRWHALPDLPSGFTKGKM